MSIDFLLSVVLMDEEHLAVAVVPARWFWARDAGPHAWDHHRETARQAIGGHAFRAAAPDTHRRWRADFAWVLSAATNHYFHYFSILRVK